MSKERFLAKLVVVTGNSVMPLLKRANELGLEGVKVTRIEVTKGGMYASESMEVELFGYVVEAQDD